MEDLNSGAQSTKEGLEFYQKVKNRFPEARLNIRFRYTNGLDLRIKYLMSCK